MGGRRAGRLTPAALLLLAGCAGTPDTPHVDVQRPVGECTAAPLNAAGAAAGARVQWLVHSAQRDRHELDEWCRGVGAPVVATAATAPVRLDSLVVITWNIHVGAAHVDSFVHALRAGAVTGGATEHFVLLVQEARRNGGAVPPLARDARGTRQLGKRDAGPAADIVATAHRLGLNLFYVPSMRNGGRDHAAEDRGNAILATLPIAELTAIELPLLAQRRVAVAATIPLLDAAGRPRALRVSSVHLDLGARASRLLTMFGAGRALQAGALADALDGYGNVVVGGDFNTWSLDRFEHGLVLMQDGFPHFPGVQTEPTFHTAGILPRRLDHLFLRAADVSGSTPARINDRFGSDHFPVMAWVRLSPDGREPRISARPLGPAGAPARP